MVDYRNATGFEALLGYLYLQEDFKRLTDVVKMGLEVLEQDE
jgi:ribonuclease-3 family protein